MRGAISKALTLAVLASAAFPCRAALGGTTLDNVSDSVYQNMATAPQFAGSGYILGTLVDGGGSHGFLGSGTLISSEWVLTVGHLVVPWGGYTSATDTSFTLANSFSSGIAQQVGYPTFAGDFSAGNDIGLIKLSTPANLAAVAPASRYYATDEKGQTVTMVGWGRGGTGITGATLVAGTKRAGQNVIDVFGGDIVDGVGTPLYPNNNMMFSDFDSPDGTQNTWGNAFPLNSASVGYEYITAAGDSGGGEFIQVGVQQRLAGVTSVGLGSGSSVYGDASGFTRVSQFNSWIDDTISVAWAGAGANDIVGFNSGGSPSVSLTGDVINEALLVRAGVVTLNLVGHSYQVTSPAYDGSLVVGKYAGNNASLNVLSTSGSGTVSAEDVAVGMLPGSVGSLSLGSIWANFPATMTCNGSLFIGGSSLGGGGTGLVSIDSGGSLVVVGPTKVFAGSTLRVTAVGTLHSAGIANDGVVSVGDTDAVATVGAITGNGMVTVAALGTLTAASIRQTKLNVHGVARIAQTDIANSSDSTSVLAFSPATALNIGGSADAWTGKFDLGNNSLIIRGGGAVVRDRAANQIHEGLYGDQNGITSSTALSNPASDTTLGWALANEISPSPFNFGGQTVSGYDVLVKYTWQGDANLDGKVNLADLTILAGNYGQQSGMTWSGADFDGDGRVNLADLTVMAAFYGRGMGGGSQPLMSEMDAGIGISAGDAGGSPLSLQDAMAMFPQFGGGAAADVPEPASLGVLGLGALGLLVRRWRKRFC